MEKLQTWYSMKMEALLIKEKYEKLLADYPNCYDDFFIKIDTAPRSEIYIGITQTRTLFFMFKAGELCNVEMLKETAGYRIKLTPYQDDFTSTKCVIEAKDKNSYEVFYVVVEDLIRVSSTEIPFPYDIAITKRLFMWEKFFKHTSPDNFTIQNQIGLFGELLFIEEQISKGRAYIIESWSGPDRATKDFIIEDNAVEIKTSSISSTNRVSISDENQLDESGFSHLYLNVRIIQQNQMNGRNLTELIDCIKMEISGDEYLLTIFNEKLIQSGFIENFKDKYVIQYEDISSSWYEVKNSRSKFFPRIIPSDLRNGVKFVKYQIELSDLEDFRISDIDAIL